MSTSCTVQELALARGVRAVRIENDLLAATVLVEKGADIYELIYKPRGLDVLWKSPWGLRNPHAPQSTVHSLPTFIEHYAGGWQEIFPSGGGPCTYKGVELNFHGEATLAAWDYAVYEEPGAAELRLSMRLFRSPFRMQRTLRVEAGQPVLIIREQITNEGGEALDYMWGHHPAFGAPFLSAACRIDIGARAVWADDVFDGPHNPLRPNETFVWPLAERDGGRVDMAQVPPEGTPRHVLGYFTEFAQGWYAITNRDLGVGVGLVWPTAVFPYAWFWQEMHASPGFPWFKGVYVMAIEPFSSIPGQGLVAVSEKTGTQRTLAPGETVAAELRAVFYEGRGGVSAIAADGTVELRGDQ